MSVWISRESVSRPVADAKQSFYAVNIEGLDEVQAAVMLAFEADIRAYWRYLHALIAAVRDPHKDVNDVEVPECLEPASPQSVEQPKKKATARRSSKKSPSTRKKKASSSSTSQPKAE